MKLKTALRGRGVEGRRAISLAVLSLTVVVLHLGPNCEKIWVEMFMLRRPSSLSKKFLVSSV